jgi:hypothetical protein
VDPIVFDFDESQPFVEAARRAVGPDVEPQWYIVTRGLGDHVSEEASPDAVVLEPGKNSNVDDGPCPGFATHEQSPDRVTSEKNDAVALGAESRTVLLFP